MCYAVVSVGQELNSENEARKVCESQIHGRSEES
jgi:hypothetical protein